MTTAERIRELLDYDPLTGVFKWKVKRTGTADADRVAGYIDPRGYLRIRVCGKQYLAHRLAFLWMTGALPTDQVDHVNLRYADNRWANLRQCSNAENSRNARKNARNTSGYKGVCWHKARGRWQAIITIDNKRLHLGYAGTPKEAAALYAAAARELHGKFARTE